MWCLLLYWQSHSNVWFYALLTGGKLRIPAVSQRQFFFFVSFCFSAFPRLLHTHFNRRCGSRRVPSLRERCSRRTAIPPRRITARRLRKLQRDIGEQDGRACCCCVCLSVCLSFCLHCATLFASHVMPAALSRLAASRGTKPVCVVRSFASTPCVQQLENAATRRALLHPPTYILLRAPHDKCLCVVFFVHAFVRWCGVCLSAAVHRSRDPRFRLLVGFV